LRESRVGSASGGVRVVEKSSVEKNSNKETEWNR
jgi:hypothetical protein